MDLYLTPRGIRLGTIKASKERAETFQKAFILIPIHIPYNAGFFWTRTGLPVQRK